MVKVLYCTKGKLSTSLDVVRLTPSLTHVCHVGLSCLESECYCSLSSPLSISPSLTVCRSLFSPETDDYAEIIDDEDTYTMPSSEYRSICHIGSK